MAKSSYLILGGCGFIGRNLVQYLLDNDLASRIRVADKLQPKLAYLNPSHDAAFSNPIVEFVSSNLLNKDSQEKVFQSEEPFDFVINCAGETRYGLTDAIYNDGIFNLTVPCAKLAAKYNAKRFIEISSGCMASNSKVPHKETDSTDPWTPIANFKLKAEKTLTTIPNLKFTILRPAVVYGVGDKTGITPRLVIAAIYRYLGETMKVLWDKDLTVNTIHVYDLCRAICFVAQNDQAVGQVYNVVDEGCTTQGIINDIVSKIFNIKISYIDNIITSMFKDKLDLDAIAEDINDKHSSPWAYLCEKNNISSTPLSSFLHKEELDNKHLYLDGTKLAQLGFTLTHPKITKEHVVEIVKDYSKRNLFPSGILSE